MQFNRNDLQQGIQDGLKRVSSRFDRSPNTEMLEKVLTYVLKHWPDNLSDQYVHLLAEMTAIAASARQHYKEPPLTSQDVHMFMGPAIKFLNSFTHK